MLKLIRQLDMMRKQSNKGMHDAFIIPEDVYDEICEDLDIKEILLIGIA